MIRTKGYFHGYKFLMRVTIKLVARPNIIISFKLNLLSNVSYSLSKC